MTKRHRKQLAKHYNVSESQTDIYLHKHQNRINNQRNMNEQHHIQQFKDIYRS